MGSIPVACHRGTHFYLNGTSEARNISVMAPAWWVPVVKEGLATMKVSVRKLEVPFPWKKVFLGQPHNDKVKVMHCSLVCNDGLSHNKIYEMSRPAIENEILSKGKGKGQTGTGCPFVSRTAVKKGEGKGGKVTKALRSVRHLVK